MYHLSKQGEQHTCDGELHTLEVGGPNGGVGCRIGGSACSVFWGGGKKLNLIYIFKYLTTTKCLTEDLF